MITAITHLKLKNIGKIPSFMKHAIKSKQAAEKTAGNLGVQVSSSGILVHRTLTFWENKEALMNFVTSKAHVEAMNATRRIASEARSAHWECNERPTWQEALARIETTD